MRCILLGCDGCCWKYFVAHLDELCFFVEIVEPELCRNCPTLHNEIVREPPPRCLSDVRGVLRHSTRDFSVLF
jgi:hypothetical protein